MQELRKPELCPKCGARDFKRIVGGRPTQEGWDMINSGQAVLGTCFESLDRPDWRCMACRHEWFDATDPARIELDQTLQRILERPENAKPKNA